MPVSWLLDTEQKPRSFFRGGGEGADDDSMSLSLPSLTPPRSVSSCHSGSALRLPLDTPSRCLSPASPSCPLSVPPGTPGSLVASGQGLVLSQALSIPPSGSATANSAKVQARTASLAGLSGLDDTREVRRRLVGKQDAPPAFQVVSDQVTWTCNLCGKTYRGPNHRNLSKRRWIHIEYNHKAERNQVNRIREKVFPVKASKELPKDQRNWTCASCGGGLPSLSKHRMHLSITAHLKDCSKISGRKNYALLEKCSTQAFAASKAAAAKRLLRHTERDDQVSKQTGHQLHRVPGKTCKGSFVVCVKCLTFWNQRPTGTRCCPQSVIDVTSLFLAWKPKSLSGPGFWGRVVTSPSQFALRFFRDLAVTKATIVALDQKMREYWTQKGIPACPPIQESQWWPDLTKEGIEPNPGPNSKTCQVLSSNLSSFHTHGLGLLRQASRLGAAVVCVQEHQLTAEGIPGAAHAVRPHGWRFTGIPKPSNRSRGGIGMFTKHPWACLLRNIAIMTRNLACSQYMAQVLLLFGLLQGTDVLRAP